MRLISLLITLIIIGFLVKKQLDSSSSTTNLEDITDSSNITIPKTPSSPMDLKKFEQDMNDFVRDNARKRSKDIDEALAE